MEAYLSERYLTENDLYAAAAALLPGSFAGGVPIYLDGLPAVTRQVLSFLEALLGAAQSLTVALTLDEQSPDADVFAPERGCVRRAQGHGRAPRPAGVRAPPDGRRAADAALEHLERRPVRLPGRAVPPGRARGDRLWREQPHRGECARCATPCSRSRARACATATWPCSSRTLDAYAGTLARVCAARGLPLFLDTRRPVGDHAAARLLLCAVRAVAGGFAAADMIDLVKTGYAGVSHEDAELFENHVLRFGVRFSRFLAPFTRGEARRSRRRCARP